MMQHKSSNIFKCAICFSCALLGQFLYLPPSAVVGLVRKQNTNMSSCRPVKVCWCKTTISVTGERFLVWGRAGAHMPCRSAHVGRGGKHWRFLFFPVRRKESFLKINAMKLVFFCQSPLGRRLKWSGQFVSNADGNEFSSILGLSNLITIPRERGWNSSDTFANLKPFPAQWVITISHHTEGFRVPPQSLDYQPHLFNKNLTQNGQCANPA